jgi:hypothetical protein
VNGLPHSVIINVIARGGGFDDLDQLLQLDRVQLLVGRLWDGAHRSVAHVLATKQDHVTASNAAIMHHDEREPWSYRQNHHRRRACEARANNFSFNAGACGCAWLCANWRRIAETPRVRSQW